MRCLLFIATIAVFIMFSGNTFSQSGVENPKNAVKLIKVLINNGRGMEAGWEKTKLSVDVRNESTKSSVCFNVTYESNYAGTGWSSNTFRNIKLGRGARSIIDIASEVPIKTYETAGYKQVKVTYKCPFRNVKIEGPIFCRP